MSFIEGKQGTVYAPGYFLVSNDEGCTRETKQIAQSGAVAVGDTKYVPMGTAYPSNDGNAIGILYEDVDVTTGDMPGSVVTKGNVYLDRLPVALADSAKSALQALGFKFVASAPAVERPY
jgi:hypothetical protein